MTQEEIEELEFLNNKFEHYSGANYTQDWPHESRRMCYLTGKKEEHDKVQEVMSYLKAMRDNPPSDYDYNPKFLIENIDNVLEKLQS